ncbi:zinc-ribbon domain-containing protein [Rhodococcus sp. JVH1]
MWWCCQKCGHEWLSAPRTRIRSTGTTSSQRIMGCPSC